MNNKIILSVWAFICVYSLYTMNHRFDAGAPFNLNRNIITKITSWEHQEFKRAIMYDSKENELAVISYLVSRNKQDGTIVKIHSSQSEEKQQEAISDIEELLRHVLHDLYATQTKKIVFPKTMVTRCHTNNNNSIFHRLLEECTTKEADGQEMLELEYSFTNDSDENETDSDSDSDS